MQVKLQFDMNEYLYLVNLILNSDMNIIIKYIKYKGFQSYRGI